MRSWMIALPIAVFATGCAHEEISATELASTQAAVRSAREVGADRVPRAALHLAIAEDLVDTAKRFSADGQADSASAALQRATLDAELARLLTREEQSQTATDTIEQRVSTLRTRSRGDVR